MNWRGLVKREALQASLILLLLLNFAFFPAIWGNKTLLLTAWDTSSVMPSGAFAPPSYEGSRGPAMPRALDAGAVGWQSEAWYKVLSDQLVRDRQIPLWNPYNSFGKPFAAGMSAQPFFPLTVLLSLHVSPWTNNLYLVSRLLVAGLLAFFFARLFLSFLPSLFCAVAFMLTGYFVMQLGMPHLSIEILLPGIFLTLELLLRRDSWGAVGAVALVILLGNLGGGPESMFLLMCFGCAYYAFRLVHTPEFRAEFWPRLVKFTVAIILGFALSAFLLLPFFEYVPISANTHVPSETGGGKVHGPLSDNDVRGLILYLLPTFGGPIGHSVIDTKIMRLWGYWGMVPSIFAFTAILCWIFPRRNALSNPLAALTLFFGASLLLLMMKQFGSPLINWVGYLPVFEQIVFVKYDAPLIGFCVAILGGIGFAQVTEGRAPAGYFLGATATVITVLVILVGVTPAPVIKNPKNWYLAYYVMPVAAIVATLGTLFLLLIPLRKLGAAWGIFGLMSAELLFTFMFPTLYWFNSLPPAALNPYSGAPYIDFLRETNKDHSRVFGREGVLYPEWSGVFQIADVRGLDALFYGRYMDFIRGLLLPRSTRRPTRFTGVDRSDRYAFHTEAERRFFALSSVKYVISITENGILRIANGVFSQHRADKIPGFGPTVFSVDGKNRAALSQYPPSYRVSYKTTIDPAAPVLVGTAALRDEAGGDGAGFLIEIEVAGKIETLFSRTVTRARAADNSFRIDLSRWAGKKVALLFSTDSGPNGDDSSDLAGWLELHFAAPDEKASPPLAQIYNKEVSISEVPDALPRASLFRTIEVLPDREVIERLKDPALDPSKTVVLSRESLNDEDLAALKAIQPSSDMTGDTAKISKYTPMRVTIDVETKAPAVLMLNDANYPGWNAYLDGKSAPVLWADFLFRGVILPAGKSTVVFAYEPTSFKLGVVISLLALGIWIALFFWNPLPARVRGPKLG